MSKKAKTSSDFTYQTAANLPKLGKVKETWDLKNLYYKSEKDARIEAAIQKTEKAFSNFQKKYASGKWTKTTTATIKAINDYLDLNSLPGQTPLYYLFYRKELNAADSKAEKMANLLESRLTVLGNTILFFELQLAKIPKNEQKKLLADKRTASFRFFLNSVFDSAKFQLSEPEEKILSLRSITSRGMWISATEKILSKKSITWKGEILPINGALMQVDTLQKKEKQKMWSLIIPVLEQIGEIAENELTALAYDKKVSDDLRGRKKPYSATTDAYDSNDVTLEKLVSVMETRGYDLTKRYYKLRTKILGEKLDYINRDEPLAKLPKVPFATAVELTREVFYSVNNDYGKIFDKMLTNGQIDVWPASGRGGGAFCSSGIGQPTLVFLNQNDSVDSLQTLAHEMGHAVHAYRSKNQPAHYEGHSTLTAETASTFFESLVAERMIELAPEKYQTALLDAFISRKIATMVTCIARFKAELAMHETIRTQGAMDYKALATTLADEFKKYCGSSIKVDWTDGLSLIWKTHYRRNFYQYSYSFGEVGSSIMRNRYNKDNSFSAEVDKFLSLGESDSVENIFKSIGIDMSKDSTFNEALDILEADIIKLEKLTKK